MRGVEFPDSSRIAKDPHHNGDFEWRFYNKQFWTRHKGSKKWICPKKAHITPARVKMWASLIEEVSDDER